MTPVLIAHLERLARRAGLTSAAALAVPSVAAVIGLDALARAFPGPAHPPSRPVVFGLAVVAAAVATAIAWVRRPGWLDVARAVDRVGALPATVVTAVDVRAQTDPFAAHVVEEAVRHLAQVQPAAVYPWHVTSAGRVAAGLGVAAVVLAAWLPPPQPEASAAAMRGGTAGIASGTAARPATSARPVGQARASATPPVRRAAADTPAPSASPAVPQQAREPGGRTDAIPSSLASAGADRDARGSAAPGGGGSKGAGPRGGAGPLTAPMATGAVQAAPAGAGAESLERVPMGRRAYVRRYLQLLSRAEPR